MNSKIKNSALEQSPIVHETISTRGNESMGDPNFTSEAGCAPPMNDQDREVIVSACVREVLRILERRAER